MIYGSVFIVVVSQLWNKNSVVIHGTSFIDFNLRVCCTSSENFNLIHPHHASSFEDSHKTRQWATPCCFEGKFIHSTLCRNKNTEIPSASELSVDSLDAVDGSSGA